MTDVTEHAIASSTILKKIRLPSWCSLFQDLVVSVRKKLESVNYQHSFRRGIGALLNLSATVSFLYQSF